MVNSRNFKITREWKACWIPKHEYCEKKLLNGMKILILGFIRTKKYAKSRNGVWRGRERMNIASKGENIGSRSSGHAYQSRMVLNAAVAKNVRVECGKKRAVSLLFFTYPLFTGMNEELKTSSPWLCVREESVYKGCWIFHRISTPLRWMALLDTIITRARKNQRGDVWLTRGGQLDSLWSRLSR